MEHAYSVKLSKIVKDLDVELIYSPYDLNDVKISSMDVNRPGLQLGGFFEYFDSSRIQLIGLSEYAYLKKFDEDTLMQKLDSLRSNLRWWSFPGSWKFSPRCWSALKNIKCRSCARRSPHRYFSPAW